MSAIPGIGGVPQGPSHEEGGMPVVNPATGQKEAEIEGGERIFSVEDTQQMEHMAQAITSAQDEEQQFQAAAQLGMFVVEAIMRQEEAQAQQQAPQAQMPQQPAFRSGGKLPSKKGSLSLSWQEKTDPSLDRLLKYIK